MKDTGTGPLGDVGVYCINASRYITGEEPVEAMGMAYQPKDEERFKDWPASYVFTLRFPSGALAHGSCGFNGNGSRRYRAFCNDGWFGLEPAYGYGGLKIQASKPDLIVDLPQINHFSTEMDHFAQRIMENRESDTPGEEGLKDMKVLEAIWRSVDSGKAEKV
jgi:predicted dehydrogenase